MKTTIGYVEDQKVEVLRDTGCSTMIVARRLVKQNRPKFSGKYELCMLIDKTVPSPIYCDHRR